MNIDYVYVKKRSAFGSPYLFWNEGPVLEDNVWPSKALSEKYILKSPVNKAVQESFMFTSHEVNTWNAEYCDRGMNHEEGGWPKDLNTMDEEAVLRFKKKLEREDNYIASMRAITKTVEHAILQNNAVNIYQKYFEDTIVSFSENESASRIRSVFKDFGTGKRSVSHLSWSTGRNLFASSHCNMKFQQMDPGDSTEAFVWDTENPTCPQTTFDSQIPIVCLEWNPVDINILVGGLYNGQVASYDLRKSPEHTAITDPMISHRDPVHCVRWIATKSGCDFFTASFDGEIKWWDVRNLSRVTDSLILDTAKSTVVSNAYMPSCLEYDPMIPVKFMVGTQNGFVLLGNRKGLTPAEKIPGIVKVNRGPVNSLERNAAFTKVYLTTGTWDAKIWSEDCKESAIIWTNSYNATLTDGSWSKGRYSVFYLTRSDGYLDTWDLLLGQNQPYISLKISDGPLTTLRGDEEGKYLLVGDACGKIYLIQYGQSMSTSLKNDKAILGAMFDRESRREKIIETRMREIRLAMKLKTQGDESKTAIREADEDNEEILKAEENYWEMVAKALGSYVKKKEEEVPEPVKAEVEAAITEEQEIEVKVVNV